MLSSQENIYSDVVRIFLYVLLFDFQPAVKSELNLDRQGAAFEDAKIVSKEMLKDYADLDGGDVNSDGGNSTVAGPGKGLTDVGDGELPEYENNDSENEQENIDESSEGSDAEKRNDADKGEEVTMKEEVIRHSDAQTKTRQDTKPTHHRLETDGEKSPKESGTLTHSKNNLPSCADEQIIKLMKELHRINPEGAVVRAIESENSRLCRKLSSGLSSIEHFMATCDLSKGEKSHQQLIQGVRSLNSKVCIEEIFRTEYLKNQDCYRKVGEDYRDCVGPAGWSEGNKEEFVCSEYIKVANCFYIKTAVRCAIHEARIMKDLVKFVVGSVLSVQCKDIEKEPDVSGLMKGIASERCYPQIMLQLLFLFVCVRNFLIFH